MDYKQEMKQRRSELRKERNLLSRKMQAQKYSDAEKKEFSNRIYVIDKELRPLERKIIELVKFSNGDIYDLGLIKAYVKKLGREPYEIWLYTGAVSIVTIGSRLNARMELEALNKLYGHYAIPAFDEKEIGAVEDFVVQKGAVSLNQVNMEVTSEILDKLGTVFIYLNYRERYGWSFEQYVNWWKRGICVEQRDAHY